MNKRFFSNNDSKVTLSQLDNVYKSLSREVNDKVEDMRMAVLKSNKALENDLFKLLDKKANLYDIQNALISKADLGSTNIAIQNKASLADLDKIKGSLDKLNKEINSKLDFGKFESFVKDSKKLFDELAKDILTKSTIKETISMLKNKADIDDVNKALTQVHEELDFKPNIEQVSYKFILTISSKMQWIIKL